MLHFTADSHTNIFMATFFLLFSTKLLHVQYHDSFFLFGTGLYKGKHEYPSETQKKKLGLPFCSVRDIPEDRLLILSEFSNCHTGC